MAEHILITGASGVVGYAALKHFAERGDCRVTAVSRRRPLETFGAQFRSLDLTDAYACGSLAAFVGREIDRRLHRACIGWLHSKFTTRSVAADMSIGLDDEQSVWALVRKILEPGFAFIEGDRVCVERNVGVFNIIVVDLEEARQILRSPLSNQHWNFSPLRVRWG